MLKWCRHIWGKHGFKCAENGYWKSSVVHHNGLLKTVRIMSSSVAVSEKEIYIKVEPGGHLLIDEELHITVKRLGNCQKVTIHTVINDEEKIIESCCCFKADKNGLVDLYNHPSLSGCYTGVSPMGIFWSMVPSPDMRKGFRMMKKNIYTPLRADMSIYNGHVTVDEIRNASTHPEKTHVIERWYKGEGVTSKYVTEGRLRGRLFLPAGSGPFPGVIDLFGTVGGLTEYRSALLASRGIASLALPYFAYKDLPKSLKYIDLDYFLEAVEWLRTQQEVYNEGIGIIGVSKGADIGLMVAANCPQVRAVVTINGCAFNALLPMKFSKGNIPGVILDKSKWIFMDGAFSTRYAFNYKESDLIPVWRHNPKVLTILSEDDLSAPIECIPFMKAHYPEDKVDNFTILSYPGAGHLLEPPYTPLCRMSYHKSFGGYAMWGGQPKSHADAQEDAWRNVLKFFHINIPRTRSCSKL